MPLLGLELNDTGILVAGGTPAQLLDVETEGKESPGFALAHNDRVILGKDAHDSARLHPRLYTNRFWDELSAEQIKQSALEGKTNAELAYLHLSKIWDNVKEYGDEMVLAVPGFFSHKQLGLILGITNELAIPIKGFAATAIAASQESFHEHLLFFLDIHLHRIEITFLEQGNQLAHKETKTIPGKGLHYLYSEWIKAIADEFVRSTRFDPFDQAKYEQELFKCLPQMLKDLKDNPSTTFAMKAGSQMHSVILTYDLLARKSKLVFREVSRIIEEMKRRYGSAETASAIQVSHRFSPLPGFREALQKLSNQKIIELERGSGARGLLELKDRFSQQEAEGVSFLTSKPWQREQELPAAGIKTPDDDVMRPTHILHKNRAYQLSAEPLIIAQEPSGDISVYTNDQVASGSQKNCTIHLSGEDVVLTNYSTEGTYADKTKVSQTTLLKLGQTIQLAPSGEELKLIACVRN
jgi:hypothetical protein